MAAKEVTGGHASQLVGRRVRLGGSAGRWVVLVGDGVQKLEQLGDVERLGQQGPGALVEQPGLQAGSGIGGQDHDRDVGGVGVGLEAAQDLGAGQVGQVQVQKDKVGVVLGGQVQAELGSYGGDQRDGWPAAEDLLDQLQVGQVVFDAQHGQGRTLLVGPVLLGWGLGVVALGVLQGGLGQWQLDPEGAALA